MADAKTGEAGRRTEHPPPHSHATGLQSQSQVVKVTSCGEAELKVRVHQETATVKTITSYSQQTEEKLPKQVSISEEKEQMEQMKQLKPQHNLPGEHNTVHSDMLFATAFSPDSDIIKRIIQDSDVDMANGVNTGARISVADTHLNIADKPSGTERSDGGIRILNC